MEIKFCTNKEEWNKGLIQASQTEFLQSFEWGEFQTSVGHKVVRLIGEGWQVQGFEHQLGLGLKYLYLPRVPSSEFLVQSLKSILEKQNYIFVRFEFSNNYELRIKNFELVKNRQPQQTLILDLAKSEDEILTGMHAKTRYNIHVAEKHGVEIRQEKNIDIFWQLNLETTSRDQFKSHDKKYYEKMLQSNIVYQLIAYYKEKPIATNILVSSSDTIVYLHGASSGDWRNLMAPYLLQWEGIKLGKKLGCQFYDFWGVAPSVSDSNPKQHTCFNGFCWEVNHPWTGVTRFKVGFGGRVKQYPKACDIILKSFYYKLYQLAKKIL